MKIPELYPAGCTVEGWEAERRPQLLRLFAEHVYGVTPEEPARAVFTVAEGGLSRNGAVRKQMLLAEFNRGGKSCSFVSRIYLPVGATGPLPSVIMLNPFSRNEAAQYTGRERDQMPWEMITAQGFAAIHADVDGLCEDNPETWQEGLWQLYPDTSETGWRAIGMWAWAASRLVDYLAARPDMDSARIAVCGCSRAGKTALWCAAQDSRVAAVISNVSGCTGAALTRGKQGEGILEITSVFPHWLCGRYASHAHRIEDLPVDQHMLLALCAPRPLYVSSASEDAWADPVKEHESCVLAGAAYSLYGRRGLENITFPAVEAPVHGGSIAYHIREGEHGCRSYDWEQYLRFLRQMI